MKPRARKPQKQTARMFLRHNDHRDCIYNGYYTDIICMPKTPDVISDLEPVWIKYPKDAMCIFSNGARDVSYGGLGYMDIDRQFGHASGFAGASPSKIYKQDDFIIALYDTGGSASVYLSEDSVIWKYMGSIGRNGTVAPSVPFYYSDSYIFGKNSIASHYQEYSTFWLNIWTFTKDEETGEWSVSGKLYGLTSPLNVNFAYFIAPTQTGGIFEQFVNTDPSLATPIYTTKFFHVDESGHLEERHISLSSNSTLFSGRYKVSRCRVGGMSAILAIRQNSYNRYVDNWTSSVLCMTTRDNGLTWNTTIFEEGQQQGGDPYFDGHTACALFARDGELFAMWGTSYYNNYAIRYKGTFTGTGWTDIPLPRWIELPLLQEGGCCVKKNPSKETLKIAVDQGATSGADTSLFEMLRATQDYENTNIKLIDGKLSDRLNEDFYLLIGGDGRGAYRAYFDNRYLAESTKAFAWINEYLRDTEEGDPVIPYDYCAPNGEIIPSTDPLGYDYYIYNKTNSVYVKVYDTTQYPTYRVVEVQYLPNIGAVNVLYKVPYWEAVTDWSDNDDYEGD